MFHRDAWNTILQKCSYYSRNKDIPNHNRYILSSLYSFFYQYTSSISFHIKHHVHSLVIFFSPPFYAGDVKLLQQQFAPLAGKRVGLITNPTAIVDSIHIIGTPSPSFPPAPSPFSSACFSNFCTQIGCFSLLTMLICPLWHFLVPSMGMISASSFSCPLIIPFSPLIFLHFKLFYFNIFIIIEV